MSRLTDLIRQAKEKDPTLGRDLEAEFAALSSRRQFGLNFERHQPEAVELPGRAPRRGDKVRILPPRGSTDAGDQPLWKIAGMESVDGTEIAHLQIISSDGDVRESTSRPVEDLIVVAEFRDPIYPGLVSTGRVINDDEKPFHTVINAENYHALQTLQFTHRGKVDAIYIDPPYNTGAKDWKYNNDYVDGEDLYRHSKWLAFMERRLKLAKELLNPDDSVLIVTIDEHEVHRLRLLLEQTFPEAYVQMVTIVTNPKGVAQGRFARVEEYALYCFFGVAGVHATDDDLLSDSSTLRNTRFWKGLLRAGTNARPQDGLGMAYPVYIDPERSRLIGAGRTLRERISAGEVNGDPNDWLPDEVLDQGEAPPGSVAVWPLRKDGSLGVWQAIPETLLALAEQGMTKCVLRTDGWAISYVPNGVRAKIDRGEIAMSGNDASGSVLLKMQRDLTRAKTVWKRARHDAGWHGSVVLRALLDARVFDFPKSLYAVRDALEPVLAHKRKAIVLDFFTGSGTTAHAVALLNKRDGGRRTSVSITNNEVGPKVSASLVKAGKRPGDPEWERYGIFNAVTVPRITAAFTGKRHNGQPVELEYDDQTFASEGLAENVEFFNLSYQSPWRVARGRAFDAVASLLWMRAGSQGRRIEQIPPSGWDMADVYGVIADLDHTGPFLEALSCAERVRVVFIVTDDDRAFQSVCAALPEHVEPVRLYESYLRNFEITGRE